MIDTKFNFFQRATLWNLIDIVVSEKRIGRIFVGFKSMIESVLTPPFISIHFDVTPNSNIKLA